MSNFAKQLAKKASVGRKALLRELNSYVTDSAVKRADIGPDAESSFEQSFASIAFTYIQEKAPSLLDFMIGFQLVDRNEDNSRAVGIFGFKLGDKWVYAPVFFLNGNMKGHELLYIKNEDTFVPLRENWINYLIAKKPHILGKPEHETAQQLGVIEPSYRALVKPPAVGKYASYVPPKLQKWAQAIVGNLGSWVTVNPGKLEKFAGLDERLDFKEFLSRDVRLVKLAIETGSKYPTIKHAIADLYGKTAVADVLKGMHAKAVKAAQTNVLEQTVEDSPDVCGISILRKEAAADEAPKLEIVADEPITKNLPEMTDAEREKLLRDGYLIKDHRKGEEVSVAYNTQIQMTLINPDATDVYDVLLEPGEFERCLVIHNPQGPKGRDVTSVIIDLSNNKKWEVCHPTKIFVKQQARGKSDIEEYRDWFDKLKSAGTSLTKDATYVILTQSAQGTHVFEVREDLGDDGYRVNWRDYGDDSRPEYLPHVNTNTFPHATSSSHMTTTSSKYVDTIFFNQREGTRLKSVNGALYIPPDAKVIKIADPPKCKVCHKTEEDCTCDYFHRTYNGDKEPIKPGNLADLQMQIMQKTSELKLWSDHSEVVINRKRMSKLAGLFHLVRDHGLREKQAKRMLKEAERFNGAKFRIKYAQPFSSALGPFEAMQGPSAGAFPGVDYSSNPYFGTSGQMEGPQTNFQEIPELQSSNSDLSVYDPTRMMDPMAMQVAQQGQQQGQKEIFDTAMISSMLKAVREDSLVDRYLPDLLKALDRLGRILFMFYWHNEEFMQRYGKQDLPELEDTLKNAFEVVGDLVLFLKEKTIDTHQMHGVGL